jgi:hypothetical protein
MVAWIRTVRQAIDAWVSTGKVSTVLVGEALWNSRPILAGTYENGTPIVDPDTNQALGSWNAQGRAQRSPRHLDHVHIEMKQETMGNGN